MSTENTVLFYEQTTDANSASFNISQRDNKLPDTVQGILFLGTLDGASIDIEALGFDSDGVALDETDDANWTALYQANPIQINYFFPIANAPDALKLRVAISNSDTSTSISAFLLKQKA